MRQQVAEYILILCVVSLFIFILVHFAGKKNSYDCDKCYQKGVSAALDTVIQIMDKKIIPGNPQDTFILQLNHNTYILNKNTITRHE